MNKVLVNFFKEEACFFLKKQKSLKKAFVILRDVLATDYADFHGKTVNKEGKAIFISSQKNNQ